LVAKLVTKVKIFIVQYILVAKKKKLFSNQYFGGTYLYTIFLHTSEQYSNLLTNTTNLIMLNNN